MGRVLTSLMIIGVIMIIAIMILIVIGAIIPHSSPGVKALSNSAAMVPKGEKLVIYSNSTYYSIWRSGNNVVVMNLFPVETKLCGEKCSITVWLGFNTADVTAVGEDQLLVEWRYFILGPFMVTGY